MPEIGRKTNGSGVGSVYKGEFAFAGGAKAMLYVDAKKPPFISFSSGGVVFYLNADIPERTKELYGLIENAAKP